MSDYTKKNLKDDFENAAEGYGLGDKLEARFGRKTMGLEQFGFSYQKMQPGFRQGFGHVHKEQEEAYIVLEGGGRAKIEDEIVDLQQWDVLRVPAGQTRAFEAGDEGLTYLAIGGNPTGDAEMVENWWSD
jgi:uncharacterized cupin superfamily protein